MKLKQVSERLKEWRKRKGLTQVEAADHICINHATYCNWEQGRNQPSRFALREIGRILERK